MLRHLDIDVSEDLTSSITTLMMEAIIFSETSLSISQTTRRYIPGDRHLNTLRLENLKSYQKRVVCQSTSVATYLILKVSYASTNRSTVCPFTTYVTSKKRFTQSLAGFSTIFIFFIGALVSESSNISTSVLHFNKPLLCNVDCF